MAWPLQPSFRYLPGTRPLSPSSPEYYPRQTGGLCQSDPTSLRYPHPNSDYSGWKGSVKSGNSLRKSFGTGSPKLFLSPEHELEQYGKKAWIYAIYKIGRGVEYQDPKLESRLFTRYAGSLSWKKPYSEQIFRDLKTCRECTNLNDVEYLALGFNICHFFQGSIPDKQINSLWELIRKDVNENLNHHRRSKGLTFREDIFSMLRGLEVSDNFPFRIASAWTTALYFLNYGLRRTDIKYDVEVKSGLFQCNPALFLSFNTGKERYQIICRNQPLSEIKILHFFYREKENERSSESPCFTQPARMQKSILPPPERFLEMRNNDKSFLRISEIQSKELDQHADFFLNCGDSALIRLGFFISNALHCLKLVQKSQYFILNFIPSLLLSEKKMLGDFALTRVSLTLHGHTQLDHFLRKRQSNLAPNELIASFLLTLMNSSDKYMRKKGLEMWLKHREQIEGFCREEGKQKYFVSLLSKICRDPTVLFQSKRLSSMFQEAVLELFTEIYEDGAYLDPDLTKYLLEILEKGKQAGCTFEVIERYLLGTFCEGDTSLSIESRDNTESRFETKWRRQPGELDSFEESPLSPLEELDKLVEDGDFTEDGFMKLNELSTFVEDDFERDRIALLLLNKCHALLEEHPHLSAKILSLPLLTEQNDLDDTISPLVKGIAARFAEAELSGSEQNVVIHFLRKNAKFYSDALEKLLCKMLQSKNEAIKNESLNILIKISEDREIAHETLRIICKTIPELSHTDVDIGQKLDLSEKLLETIPHVNDPISNGILEKLLSHITNHLRRRPKSVDVNKLNRLVNCQLHIDTANPSLLLVLNKNREYQDVRSYCKLLHGELSSHYDVQSSTRYINLALGAIRIFRKIESPNEEQKRAILDFLDLLSQKIVNFAFFPLLETLITGANLSLEFRQIGARLLHSFLKTINNQDRFLETRKQILHFLKTLSTIKDFSVQSHVRESLHSLVRRQALLRASMLHSLERTSHFTEIYTILDAETTSLEPTAVGEVITRSKTLFSQQIVKGKCDIGLFTVLANAVVKILGIENGESYFSGFFHKMLVEIKKYKWKHNELTLGIKEILLHIAHVLITPDESRNPDNLKCIRDLALQMIELLATCPDFDENDVRPFLDYYFLKFWYERKEQEFRFLNKVEIIALKAAIKNRYISLSTPFYANIMITHKLVPNHLNSSTIITWVKEAKYIMSIIMDSEEEEECKFASAIAIFSSQISWFYRLGFDEVKNTFEDLCKKVKRYPGLLGKVFCILFEHYRKLPSEEAKAQTVGFLRQVYLQYFNPREMEENNESEFLKISGLLSVHITLLEKNS